MRYKKLNDKAYPVLLIVFGCVFLTVTGGWDIYTEPLKDGAYRTLSVFDSIANGQTDGIFDFLAVSNEGKINGSHIGDSDVDGDLNGDGNMSDNDGLLKDDDNSGGPEDVSGNAAGDSYGSVNYITVEDDYFADAVFIGDSRTVGLYEYGNLEEISDFYASTGLTVYKLFTDQIVEVPGQKKKITVEDAFAEKQFAKIYLMIGINEMGTGTPESFLEKYAECVGHIRELQPDAIIYLQSIMNVTEERSEQGDYITNEGIDVRNEGIAELADNDTIFYLDVNESICDENGAMNADYTYDGVHLKAQYISLWKDYLKCHVVEK